MDSEFDSFDDILATPGNDNVAAKKFKPKAKGRPNARPRVVLSTVPTVNSTSVVKAAVEKPVEVTDLSFPNGANPIDDGDSHRLNNVDEPHLRVSVNQVGLVSTELQETGTSEDGNSKGNNLLEELAVNGDGNSNGNLLGELAVNGGDGCTDITMEQNSNSAEAATQSWNPFDDIDLGQTTGTAKHASRFRPKLKSCPRKQTLTSAESEECHEEDTPLEDPSRVRIQNSSADVVLDDAQLIFENSEEVCLQSMNFSEVSKNDNENQNCGRTEPESHGLFDSDLVGSPSNFPPANDYFSMNEHSTYSSAAGGPSATLLDDDMNVETAQEISSGRVDDCVPEESNGTKKPPRAPRKRKARSSQPSDAVNEENNGLEGEPHSDSAVDPDVSNNNIDGDANLKKRGVKRSRKSAPDGVKQTRSRKKVNETSSEQSEKPKKKFSHSTRGRRKSVDPMLLATPDDEIDHLSVPLKDLIQRAEILERESKKAPTPSNTPTVSQRIETPPTMQEPIRYWDSFESDQPEADYQYDDYDVKVREASSYFNYHSYMKKTPRVKWTKLDTELFYQGIRQFGTDFTLIQRHHFPGRTRNQIKSKYKKEEREQPVRLTEAIENRAGGVSHFQQLIEQLKAAEVQESQDLDDDPDSTEPNDDNINDASEELNGNSLERREEEDVAAKEDTDAVDVTEMEDVEKMDDNYDEFEWGSSYKCL